MWINRTIAVLTGAIGVVTLPISIVTMNLGGLVIGCTGPFVILAIPCVLLLGLSLIWPTLRTFALLGLGLALAGLLVLPAISVIWLPFYLALLALSRLYRSAPWLSIPIGVVGVPIAVVGGEFIGLLPAFGEFEQKWVKQSVCHTFPFSGDFLELYSFTQSEVPEDLGVTFSFDRIDLSELLVDGAISDSQFQRWSRVRGLWPFQITAGPYRADQR